MEWVLPLLLVAVIVAGIVTNIGLDLAKIEKETFDVAD